MNFNSVRIAALAFSVLIAGAAPKLRAADKTQRIEISSPTAKPQKAEEKAPKIQFDKTVENYGVAQEGDKITRRFTFTNTGTGDLIIDQLQPTCGCTAAAGSTSPVKPGETGYIEVTYDSRGKIGHAYKDVRVISNAEGAPQTIAMEGTIVTGVHPEMRSGDVLFQGTCMQCHSMPAEGKEGKELYDAVCAICHDLPADSKKMIGARRDVMAELDKSDLKKYITKGLPGTSMPGFGTKAGGPLSKKQIKSIVAYLGSIKKGAAKD